MSAPEPGALRLFIAVPPPPAVVEAAEAAALPLRGAGDVRWVASANLHLTLKFLGPTPPDRLPPLREILSETANGFLQFVVELTGVGAFPDFRRPRTVWLGVEGSSRLAELADAVDRAVTPLGFPPNDHPFRGHLTLGRVRSPRGIDDLGRRLREQAARAVEPVAWPVEELHLVRSDLRPAGPEYTCIEQFALRGEEPAPAAA